MSVGGAADLEQDVRDQTREGRHCLSATGRGFAETIGVAIRRECGLLRRSNLRAGVEECLDLFWARDIASNHKTIGTEFADFIKGVFCGILVFIIVDS